MHLYITVLNDSNYYFLILYISRLKFNLFFSNPIGTKTITQSIFYFDSNRRQKKGLNIQIFKSKHLNFRKSAWSHKKWWRPRQKVYRQLQIEYTKKQNKLIHALIVKLLSFAVSMTLINHTLDDRFILHLDGIFQFYMIIFEE